MFLCYHILFADRVLFVSLFLFPYDATLVAIWTCNKAQLPFEVQPSPICLAYISQLQTPNVLSRIQTFSNSLQRYWAKCQEELLTLSTNIISRGNCHGTFLRLMTAAFFLVLPWLWVYGFSRCSYMSHIIFIS